MEKENKTYNTEGYLVREALVKEIRDADRWQTVVSAWEALLNVRRMIKEQRNCLKSIRDIEEGQASTH